jgi:hypothetical protein
MTINTPSREELGVISHGNPRGVRFFEQLSESAQRDETFTLTSSIGGLTSFSMGGIPVWAREVEIALSGCGMPDTSDFLVQIGGVDAAGLGFYYTSGYFSSSSLISGAVPSTTTNNLGYHIRMNSSSEFLQGSMRIIRLGEGSSRRWISSHSVNAGTNRVAVGGGRIIISEELSQIRLINTTGVPFDSGFVGFSFRR